MARMAQLSTTTAETPGLAVRRIAADILDHVLRRHRPLDEQLDGAGAHPGLGTLSERDRALTRAIIAMVLRRLGTLRHLLGLFLNDGTPADAPRVETAMLIGAAQILWLQVPDHAAVDLAVRLVHADRKAARYAALVNAVLRRVGREGTERLTHIDATALNTPAWLLARWIATYGGETARAIATANGLEPALDFTVKQDAAHWAQVFGGRVLPTGSVRAVVHGPVAQLPGYGDGAWWVQDAAAALPARLLGDIKDQSVADLCAAPGGKTAQLAAMGAKVVCVERTAGRVARLTQNLTRLGLQAETVVADAAEWMGGPFDAVLLDAPCSSTGTIRRHPDIPWIKQEADISNLAALQRRLVAHAVELTRPGGVLVFCTCSLEPEEGPAIIDDLVRSDSRVRRRAISPTEFAGLDPFVTDKGDLRTLPCHLCDPNPQLSGLDGFYAARLVRI